ncbi:uncharacterized protein LOC121406535 [Lytechinus variegatus]|uniref:uncharacterized protein LOC121406535 n=1 Tax=Lytechinus variegatus TaxID=7654 RepID=UPI001BB271AF|nr:uncharacterized protein LOC121406535 [Lytechinus variegatus]
MENAVEIKTSVTSIDDNVNEKSDDHINDVKDDHNDDEEEPIVLHDDDQCEAKDLGQSNNGFDDETDLVDEEENKSTKEDNTEEEETGSVTGQSRTEKGDNTPNSEIDSTCTLNPANVITTQPSSSAKDAGKTTAAAVSDIDVDIEESSKLEYELAIVPGACLSASAGVGSASKDLCDGFTNLECRYPNVGCELSCGCDDGLQLVTDCTMELCSANCILGCLGFSLGLALDTKATWNQDGVEFEVLGTGIETSQGRVFRVLGSGIGIIDSEKRETMKLKKKAKEARKAAEKEKDKTTELEKCDEDNTAEELKN